MLPDDVQAALRPHIEGAIQGHETVSGGCIANAGRLETNQRTYFLKWSRDDEVARTFPAEAHGLRILGEAGSPLVVASVVAVQDAEGDAPGFLLADWIETGTQPAEFWASFGEGLAQLHRRTAERYGFDGDNFIGQLPQRNTWQKTWPDFIRYERLAPQVALARERDRWPASWDALLEALYDRLDSLLPARPPGSLLHGDLWSGNFMVAADGRAALFDPAVYYGHREADLAMTELFGGFKPPFYEAYRSAWPLEPGYEERRAVYNLYHLINHLNHFGRSYAGRVERLLRRFA